MSPLASSVAAVTELPPMIVNARDGSTLVLVPDGDYLAGEGAGEHIRSVADFYLAATPITNAQYAEFTRTTGHRSPRFTDPRFSHPDAPVVGVSWNDASAYATWAGLRLPGESEWEKAAVVSGQVPQRLTDVAWFRDNSDGRPHPVAQLSANRLGIYDMLGNVSEWTADAADEARRRLVRGGSWRDAVTELRATRRDSQPAIARTTTLGFRCARSADGAPAATAEPRT